MTENTETQKTTVTHSQAGIIGDNATVFNPDGAAHILHLSDLHFSLGDANPAADAKKWCGQLADDLDSLGCGELQAVVISGDIGNFSDKKEYDGAEVFVDWLCETFGLGGTQFILVPGNHDLNWNLSKKGYRLMDVDECDRPLKDGRFIRVSDDVIRLRNEAAYPKRFDYFSRFHETITGNSYPTDPQKQALFYHLPELNLLIVGFNSCWEADHHFKNRISINPDAVEYALDQIRKNQEFRNCMKWAVWHHPLSSPDEDRIKDHGFMQRLAQAEFQVCLHGHIHKADAGLFRYGFGEKGELVHIVGAGTFGAPVKEWRSGYPLQYNLLRLSGDVLRVETRRRIELNGAWEADHQWRQGKGEYNLPYYDIPLVGGTSSKKPLEPKESPENTPRTPVKAAEESKEGVSEAEIRAYCKKTESFHDSLPVAGFAENFKVPIDLEDIYIPLRAMMNLRGIDDVECYGDALEAEKHLARRDCGSEIPLKEAFVQAEKRGQKGLVILGDPGSGKTTHMKRMLLWCLRQGPETLGLPENMLPVFLPLRELRDPDKGLDHFIQAQLTGRHLKMRPDFGRRLLESHPNLLFLLDGLDEVADLSEREEVAGWIEEAFTDYSDCRFVVTCRFAGYSPSVRLNAKFLEMHVRPLSEDEAERFVRNWYTIVERVLAKDIEQAGSIAAEKADHLIERLKQEDFRARRVFEMTRNPLLLTNICMVHRHRGTLPKRRARLYEECIDVLLEHWREAKKLNVSVTALQGRQVLQPAALWLHQEEGRTRATADELAPQMEPVIKEIQWQGGDAHDFLRTIRDESGLLTGWDQEHYGFMHLGFQEYLAAREIRSRFQQEIVDGGQSKLIRELAGHFGESWWQEVALLLLALEDPPLFVPFMREVVKQPSFVKNADMVEMCLDDSVVVSPKPFVELLGMEPGTDQGLWERQLLGLRILERMNGEALENAKEPLREHPFDKIQQWIQERFKEAHQNVIWPEPSTYELVFIKGGTFLMGSPEDEEGRDNNEGPQHEVTVSNFYMGRYPVTNEEYGRFMAATGYKEPKFWADRKYNQPNQPVVGVNWYNAKIFADWAGLQLPTEAQWEYACRAGTTTRFFWGDKVDCSRANYGNGPLFDECKDVNPGRPSPVGDYPPNDWGLYDMHGNVWEWCLDWSEKYSKDNVVDPTGPEDGSNRVLRGGSWLNASRYCRSAYRGGFGLGSRDNRVGFRLVLLPGQQEPVK